MPLMRVDMIRGRSKAEIRQILDIAYQVASEEFHLLPRDRYQVVTQHEPEEMVIEDVGLGLPRSTKFLLFRVDCKINPNAVRTKKDQLPLKWCLPQ
ncbi:tautomerase family protein, partial [Levilactobacillus brevis]|uniref:tautomerase family protein n=1 Tax=Levilactobacillus brevis TaxID=1580 RepID=UPI0020137C66